MFLDDTLYASLEVAGGKYNFSFLFTYNIISSRERVDMDKKEASYFINGEQYIKFSLTEKTLYVLGMIDSILSMLHIIDPDKYQTIKNKVRNLTSSQLRKVLDDYLKKNPQSLSFCVARSFLYALDEIIQE